MSLRARLVLTVLGLLVLGLVIALGATSGALQDWKGDQDNDVLTAAGRHLTAELRDRPRLAETTGAGDVEGVWRKLAEDGDVPSLFQVRAPDGRLRQSVSHGPVPDLPDPLPAAYWPAETTEENPDGERFGHAETAAGPNWLIRTSRLNDDGDMLVLGVRTARTDELLSRAMNVALVSGVVALLAVALLSSRAVRRGLRPLAGIADAAHEIGAGDLTRRVPTAKPNTEIGVLSSALNSMLGQLETAFAQRQESQDRLRRFVADASHELRTPIATIQGHAELFRRGAATRPDDLAKVMHRIESEAHRMGLLVDELLLLARLDQNQPLASEPVELTVLAAEAVEGLRATEPTRDLTLEADGPVTVFGDAARLRQVLDNLLANVVRHTPATASAVVRVRGSGDRAVIEVADTGPGIAEADRAKVFERFFRADPARSRDNGGAGLGLSIVAAVVTAHGGAVTVDSGPGATFRVELPRDSS